MNKPIYADYNATTPLCPSAQEKVSSALTHWGNPSSTHTVGRSANQILEKSREKVAECLGVAPSEIVFTSGGSEANALAIWGSFLLGRSLRLLTSRLEHSSCRGAAEAIQEQGAKVEYVRVLPSGDLDYNHFTELLRSFKPDLVSLMTANNETGVLFPVEQFHRDCKSAGIVFHTDAVQAFGKVENTRFSPADLISVSAHKIYGPKGVGALAIRGGRKLVAMNGGGTQELKRRGGTHNLMGIAGFWGACEALPSSSVLATVKALRDRFENLLGQKLDGITIQGASVSRVPNTSNVRFVGVASEILMSCLDIDGICVSGGSACSSGSISPSPVLLEMGMTPEQAKECIRFSWGMDTTEADIDSVVDRVVHHVSRIRSRRKNGAPPSSS